MVVPGQKRSCYVLEIVCACTLRACLPTSSFSNSPPRKRMGVVTWRYWIVNRTAIVRPVLRCQFKLFPPVKYRFDLDRRFGFNGATWPICTRQKSPKSQGNPRSGETGIFSFEKAQKSLSACALAGRACPSISRSQLPHVRLNLLQLN